MHHIAPRIGPPLWALILHRTVLAALDSDNSDHLLQLHGLVLQVCNKKRRGCLAFLLATCWITRTSLNSIFLSPPLYSSLNVNPLNPLAPFYMSWKPLPLFFCPTRLFISIQPMQQSLRRHVLINEDSECYCGFMIVLCWSFIVFSGIYYRFPHHVFELFIHARILMQRIRWDQIFIFCSPTPR